MADWFRDHRLYVAEFKSGVLKIGITSMPGDRRIRSLQQVYGPIVRHHFADTHQSMGFFTERTLYERMGQIGKKHKGREWFTGVRFSLAKQLADQVTRAALATGVTCQKAMQGRVKSTDERGGAVHTATVLSFCPAGVHNPVQKA